MSNYTSFETRFYSNKTPIKVFCQKGLIAVKFNKTIENAMTAIEEAKALIRTRFNYVELFSRFKDSLLQIYSIGGILEELVAGFIDLIKKHRAVDAVLRVYTLENNKPLFLTDRLVWRYDPENATESFESILNMFSMEVVSRDFGFNKNTFICRALGKLNSLEVSNLLMKNGYAVHSHPEWLEAVRSNRLENLSSINAEPRLASQWHLTDMEVPKVWNSQLFLPSTGKDIKIAMIDDGFHLGHPKLSGTTKIVAKRCLRCTSNIGGHGNCECTSNIGGHGTCCAGLALANQSLTGGISGVAPDARLMPISVFAPLSDDIDLVSQPGITEAIKHAVISGADVISCSLAIDTWGLSPDLETAIIEATTNGRVVGSRGLGCTIVWAAGDTATGETEHGEGSLKENLVASHANVIAVGSTAKITENRASYSEFGLELDIVAPGGDQNIVTIDDSRFYTETFGATSASTPMVAGVIALMLAIKPGLSREQICGILFDTTKKVGGVTYSSKAFSQDFPNTTWHKEYGYGMVNAFEAVKRAARI